jgi:hypothetical protein
MKKKVLNKTFFILAFLGLLSVQINGQIVESFSDATASGGFNGWATYTAGNGSISYVSDGGLFGDGAIELDRINSNAGFRNDALGLNPSTYPVVKVRFKNLTDADNFRIQGDISSNTTFNTLIANNDDWTTYYMDFTGNADWTGVGTINAFHLLVRRNAPDAEGKNFILDEISFLTAMPTADTTAPVFNSTGVATAIDENSGAGQVVYTASATDNVAVLYYAISGADAELFTINPSTGAVTLIEDPNFESKENYAFNVTAYDENTSNGVARNSTTLAVTLAINDVAESGDTNPPVITSLTTASIAENVGASQAVYTITATDDTGVTTYGLAGTDAADFSISGAVITLTGNPDFETKSSYSFDVTAGDAAGNTSDVTTVTLTITDVFELIKYTFDADEESWTAGANPPNLFASTIMFDGGSGGNTGLAVVAPREDNSTPNPGNTVTQFTTMYGPNNNGIGINADSYTHIKVTLKNETLGNRFRVRCKPNGGSYSQQDFVISANDTEFKSYTFFLNPAQWSGTNSDIALVVYDTEFSGSTPWTSDYKVSYDSVEFTIAQSSTTPGTWNSVATWGGVVPGQGDPKIINNNVIINSAIVSDGSITINGGNTLTITSDGSLTLNSDLVTNDGLILESGAQLIVTGSAAGNAAYKRTLTSTSDGAAANLEGWFTVSPPVSGEALNTAWADANALANGSGSNRGLATYNENGDTWSYFSGAATTFDAGKGYIVKRTTDGTVTFTGSINTADSGVDVAVTKDGNGFNLLGNPYTSKVNSATFLADNSANLALQQIWVWNDNGNTYNAITSGMTFKLAPGQAFFVQANAAATLNFAESNQEVGADTFQKTSNSKIKLNVNNGKTNRYAEVYYNDIASLGFDNGYEGETFGGIPDSFSLYTHLLADDLGKNYQIQSLPNADLESMIIPVGVKVEGTKEITFTVEAANIPAGLNVYLEDRQENTLTQLDELNAEYKVSVTEASNGIGRFYLHTSAKGALSTTDVVLNSVSIYKSDNSTLKIAGLKNGKAAVSIFNILGKNVLSSSFEANGVKEISLPKLAAGVYIVQLTTVEGKLNKKIILE